MKAYLTRSPIFVHLNETDLNDATLKIWIEDDADNFDVANPTNYSLFANAINEKVTFEISELLRSENEYLTDDFLEVRDTAKWALLEIQGRDDALLEVEKKTFLIRFRDGYIERDAPPQIIRNEQSNDITDVADNALGNLVLNKTDPFDGDNAYEATVLSNNINQDIPSNILFSVEIWIKKINANNSINLTFILNNLAALQIVGDQVQAYQNIGYNKIEYNGWTRHIVSAKKAVDSSAFLFGIESFDVNGDPTPALFYGFNMFYSDRANSVNDFLLQDASVIKPKDKPTDLVFDRLWTNNTLEAEALLEIPAGGTALGITDLDINDDLSKHSVPYELPDNAIGLDIDLDIDNNIFRDPPAAVENVNECKYENHKVEFINRFGVVQVLWFFFKRTDTLDQDNESYKPHQVNNGIYNRNLGGERLIQKQGKRKTKLSSGFYPESFNSAFQQLFYSLNVWLDGEPVKVTDSSQQVKTQLNDKIINYDVQFEYTNKEVNNIR